MSAVTPYIIFRGRSQTECEAFIAANPRVLRVPHKIVYKERDWLPEGREWQVLASERLGFFPSRLDAEAATS